jgi:D-3-phosphoglycerate dehydrogenase
MMNRTVKILVADDVSERGLEPLRSAGFEVEKRTALSPDELCKIIRDYDALIVRSETKVTARLMDAAERLRSVGRAGVGVDNIDVPAATARGIVVMNAPDGNTVTTAEHTLALLMSVARRIPQADASLKQGRWERKRFLGVELRSKTLGIIGLGRIGHRVANGARGLGMSVVAYDPYLAREQVLDQDLEIASFEDVLARADFLTVHTPLTPETRGIIGRVAFSRMKEGVRVINCARGGIIDERALFDAIKEGRVAGAALDVFEDEPPAPDHPLLSLEEVITTPHLGASTREAQDGVAFVVAEQVRDFLLTGVPSGAVNLPAVRAEEIGQIRPVMMLAEILGRFQAQLNEGGVSEVEVEYAGEIAELNAASVTRSFLAGLLRHVSARGNIVNALLIAEERGIAVKESFNRTRADNPSVIRTRVSTSVETHVVEGTLFGPEAEGRITFIDGFRIEAAPRGHLLVMYNRDVPGVIGHVGTVLGRHDVNISRFHLGREQRGGRAMSVVETDVAPDDIVLEELQSSEQVISIRRIELAD